MANAVVTNLVNLGGDRRLVGASTITQQVAKNFLLSGELSFSRKIKEAILAMRIEDTFTKDRILELYLNEIYLGSGSYGVAAAALNYFDRSLNDLSLEEIAYLAALPKAPNNYHPVRKREAAVGRRNWVLGQMVANGAVGVAEAEGRDAGAAAHQGAGARDLRRSPALRRGGAPLAAGALRRRYALRRRPLGPHDGRPGPAGDGRPGAARWPRCL